MSLFSTSITLASLPFFAKHVCADACVHAGIKDDNFCIALLVSLLQGPHN